MGKVVTVKKEHTIVYEVEGDPSDKEAIEMVKARMQTQSPLGLCSDTEKIIEFSVAEVQD